MDYYVMEQIQKLPSMEKEIVEDLDATIYKVHDLRKLKSLDYIKSMDIISNRFKQLLDLFLPERAWRPCVFVDTEKVEQEAFWHLSIEDYMPEEVEFHNDGFIFKIKVSMDTPRIFRLKHKRGTFIIVHVSIAESVLRRNILGLEFMPIQTM